MNTVVHAGLLKGAFLVILSVVFVAVVFRPQRVRDWPQLTAVVCLLVAVLMLDVVATLFFAPTDMRVYLTEMRVIAFAQYCGLAVAILLLYFALADSAFESVRGLILPEPTDRDQNESEVVPPRSVPDDVCQSCGQRMPADANQCPACGWTWGSGEVSNT